MNWTSKNQIARHFPKAMPLLLLFLAGVLFLGLCGCAQNGKELKPIPLMPKAEGLSIAGKFRAVVIEDMDNDGNLDILGGASSPGMVTINYGDGQGGVSKPQPLYVVGDVRSVAVADVNEDGLAEQNQGDQKRIVRLNIEQHAQLIQGSLVADNVRFIDCQNRTDAIFGVLMQVLIQAVQ